MPKSGLWIIFGIISLNMVNAIVQPGQSYESWVRWAVICLSFLIPFVVISHNKKVHTCDKCGEAIVKKEV
jgi:hypothetical protein